MNETFPKLSRIEHLYWKYPESNPENLYKDPEGNVVVKDMSQECTLRLDKSGLFFEVQFQSLIPTKHPYYVNVMEKDSTQKSQGVIQLCYEYAKLGHQGFIK